MSHINQPIIIITLSALMLTACSSTPYQYWHKEGASAQITKDTLGYCRHDVGANDLSSEKANKLVAYCMKSKGFILKTGYR